MEIKEFCCSQKTPLIYVINIEDERHKDALKIGYTTFLEDFDNQVSKEEKKKRLNKIARHRIDQYTKTAGISYNLLYTEVGRYKAGQTYQEGKLVDVYKCFIDHDVHKVLLRSGVKKANIGENAGKEWFKCGLEEVKKAIEAIKAGRSSFTNDKREEEEEPIVLRQEQREAIDKSKKVFSKKGGSHKVLWNAKMRFGKTLAALTLIKELQYKKTLILTHRPVVNDQWYEDYKKVFKKADKYQYFSKRIGEADTRLKEALDKGESVLYFVSIQDLRGSEVVGGKFNKNDLVFNTAWEAVIVDEGHEGTQTTLGKNTLQAVTKEGTRVLTLSGTPFNLFSNYEESEIYTWDYIMEQRRKETWESEHPFEANPYAALPRLSIYTYDLGEVYKDYKDGDAFNFKEFFRVDSSEEFIHKKDVVSFINLLIKESDNSNYPYSKKVYRDNFRHSLWVLPGVKEARALSALLKENAVFSQFKIVNVAGEGDKEIDTKDALKAVKDAIGEYPENTYTITLTCGRLTTGVTIPAWTACFMLAGGYTVAAKSYMQTIFRTQSSATIGGRIKEEAYVFDFAPDRTLKILAEVARVSSVIGGGDTKTQLGRFSNFCPVIAIDGSRMEKYNTKSLFDALNKVYIEKVVESGFSNDLLYNNEMLKLDNLQLKEFDDLKKIIGKTPAMQKTEDIILNAQGLTEEEHDAPKPEITSDPPSPPPSKPELTPEEKERLKELKKAQEDRRAAISILRGLSIRMPLMIYGAGIKEGEEITLDNFSSLIDEESWKEFMPQGVTKEIFNGFKKYYEPEIFRASAKRIREQVLSADNLTIEERIERITTLFSTFRNPDKETVLTPWKTVNMHLKDTIGGYTFFEVNKEDNNLYPIGSPKYTKYIYKEGISNIVFNRSSRVLEINSKTGLYPLYLAYTFYRGLKDAKGEEEAATIEGQKALWKEVVEKNIFVICKTKMAKEITRRTLAGFSEIRLNLHYFTDLIGQVKNKKDKFVKKICNKRYWKEESDAEEIKEGKEESMIEWNAIVGNPPYQEMDGGAQASARPLYHRFVEAGVSLNPHFLSLITPARWYAGGKGLDEFRGKMLHDTHIRELHDYQKCEECFPNTSIEGGVSYFLWDREYNKKECKITNYIDKKATSSIARPLLMEDCDIFLRYNDSISIYEKVKKLKEPSFSKLISTRKPFGLPTDYRGKKKEIKGKENVILYETKGVSYIDKDYIVVNRDLIDKHKVYISKAYGIGSAYPSQVINKAFYGKPGTACTETYLAIGAFSSKVEAENAVKYLATQFTRFLVFLRKITQDNTRDTYSFVPLQDFTEGGDIDWKAPIAEIDKQLYKKYALTDKEKEFIEKMVRPMDK